MSKLFIICGHGENDPGACGNGYQEAERVRALAKRIKELGGENVIVGDISKNWYARKMINTHNIPKDALVLELHMDSASAVARGAHVIIDADYEPDQYDVALANMITSILPGRSQGIVKRNNLANPNRAQASGINYRLMECGFISNAEDVAIFNSKMDDIVKGILECFGIEVSNAPQPAPTPKPEPTPSKPSENQGNPLVRDGQIHARNFAVPGLVADGIVGPTTRKARVKILQQAMNLDYGVGLIKDGIWGPKSERALGKHTVRRGETQYMVTALEILLMLKGYDAHGVENPGIFGSGLEKAVRKYQAVHNLSVDGIAGYNTFKSLIQ